MIVKIIILWLFALSVLCCRWHDDPFSSQWRSFKSDEAGIEASFPCEPQRAALLPEDEESRFFVYSFKCELQGVNFLISKRKHQRTFNDETIENTFEDNRVLLRSIFGEPGEFIESEEILTSGFRSRIYRLSLIKGGFVSTKVVVNEEAVFEAMVSVIPDEWETVVRNGIDLETVEKRFIDSFAISR